MNEEGAPFENGGSEDLAPETLKLTFAPARSAGEPKTILDSTQRLAFIVATGAQHAC
jgi:hypothetical protein